MRPNATALKDLTAGFLVLTLAACGSGLNSSSGSSSGSGGGGGSTATPNIVIGSGSSGTFAAGVLSIAVANLSAGGSTSVTATLVDKNNNNSLYSTDTPVTFTSTCVSSNLATLTSPVSTGSTGTAVSTYVAKGCNGTDTVTATATVNSVQLTATATLTVKPAVLGSIQFQSATPTDITLKGMGGAGQSETSTVIFKVFDSTGGIAVGKTVSFTLSTSVGGIALQPASAKSDANGNVQTVVQSGTVPTPVSVTATVQGPSGPISTGSGQLTIHSGIPAQNAFSLAVATHNIESFNTVGVIDKVSVQLGDRFNNPVPDGTPINFHTEGGLIDPSCTTVNGVCTVDWKSGNPQPVNGRVTIMAYAVGEESFTDNNGNGVFDNGDSFVDLAEIFEDNNENGSYNSGEFYYDFDLSNTHTAADGVWEGINCKDSTGRCGTRTTTGVGSNNLIIMSTFFANINVSAAACITAGVITAPCAFTVTITDGNGNPMAAGTTFTIATTNGTMLGGGSFVEPDETQVGGADSFPISIVSDGTSSSGVFTVTVTSKPSGSVTSLTLSVND